MNSTEDKVKQTEQHAKDLAESVRAGASEARDRAAGAGEMVAEKLREGSGAASDTTANFATKLEGASEYVRSADGAAVRKDLQELVRAHPMQALVAGVVGGFFLARLLRM